MANSSIPPGVTVTPDNHILVVDQDNTRVQKFAMDGSFVAAVGSKGNGKGSFDLSSEHCCPS